MTKISDLTALTGAGVDDAVDLFPIVDMSAAGAARNKKITIAEAKLALDLGTAADLDIDIDDTLAADSDSLIPTQQAVKAYVDASVGTPITELDDIPDVNAPAPSNGDVLTWDSTPGEWVSTAPTGSSGIDVEDEGVSEATGATTLNFVGAGVVAADMGGGVVDVTIAGGGSGIDVEDEGVSEATGASTLNFTGAGVTATDMGGGVVDIDIPGGGGAAWALAGTGQTATGVYDFAVDGAKANIDFIGLGSFNELLVIARDLTNGTSGQRCIQASVNNGSSFYTTAGDYISIATTGAASNTTVLGLHDNISTAARTVIAQVRNLKGAAKYCTSNHSPGNILFVASASDINAIRITNITGGGNMTGGTVRVYAR